MGSGTLLITLPSPPGPRAALLLLIIWEFTSGIPPGNGQALSPTTAPLPLGGSHEQRREFRAVTMELPVSHIACTGTSAALGCGCWMHVRWTVYIESLCSRGIFT